MNTAIEVLFSKQHNKYHEIPLVKMTNIARKPSYTPEAITGKW